MPELLSEKAAGVYMIAATPFLEDGTIDYPSIDRLVEFYIEAGVSGLTVLGMMGEAQKLAPDEAAAVLDRFLSRTRDRVPIVAGVSNSGLDNLAAAAKSAMAKGAAGAMVAPPPGVKTETQVLGYFTSLCEAVGPDVPICYQDYPQATGADICAETLTRLFETLSQIVMLKHEDWPGLNKISGVRRLADERNVRRVAILVGNGGLFFPQELARGADGSMTGFAYPEMLVGVFERFRSGQVDAAETLFDAYLPLVRYEQQPGIGLAIRKEILRRRGAIRSAKTRAPGPRLNEIDLSELTRLIGRLERRLAEIAT